MLDRFTWSFSTIVLCLISIFVAACNEVSTSAEPIYQGDLQTTVTTNVGPLDLELWRVRYSAGNSGVQDGTLYVQRARTSTALKMTNHGDSTIILWEVKPPGESIQRNYYLVDDQDRTYKRIGWGWTRYQESPDDPSAQPVPLPTDTALPGTQRLAVPGEGTVPPGETAEFTLIFEGIPQDVKELTLVLEDVPDDRGNSYTISLPVPLP